MTRNATTAQTVMVEARDDMGEWISAHTTEGQLTFLSTRVRPGETPEQAAARCVLELMNDKTVTLGGHDFIDIGRKSSPARIFRLHWLLPRDLLASPHTEAQHA